MLYEWVVVAPMFDPVVVMTVGHWDVVYFGWKKALQMANARASGRTHTHTGTTVLQKHDLPHHIPL